MEWKVKIRMYMDLFSGIDPAKHCVIAYSTPMIKAETAKRIAFTVEVPDSLIFQVDGEAAGTSKIEELK